MRIATSALLSMAVTLPCAIAIAQPAPVVPPPGPPEPPPSPAAAGGVPDAAAPKSDAPPPPPVPGAAEPAQLPPPTLPIVGPSETVTGDATPPLAGWHGNFFIRDPKDYFRIYPRLRLHIDFTGSFGSGVSKVAAIDGGNALKARLFLRRLEVELGGEFLKRWTFNGGFDVTQPISNANGRTENYASKPGETPTESTARFAATQTPTAAVGIADTWINYSAAPWLNLMMGQFNAPFSMENRTGNKTTSFMERNVAIRGFVRPSNKEIGLTLWGEVANKLINYEIGVFGGDGQNRPQIDNNVDFIGRVFVKPFSSKTGSLLQKAQIGLSGFHGVRDPKYVGYDYPSITSGNGYALWNPAYKDSLGRNIHVIPSAGQNAIGGELRLPIWKSDLRFEMYYVSNGTREAVEGYQLTNNERFGSVHGLGLYAQASVWLGDAFVSGDPGLARPTRMDLSKRPDPPKRGFEAVLLFAATNASYDGASRQGEYDANTPGNKAATSNAGTAIDVNQYAVGVNYWHSSYVRATANYSIYHTPSSGSTDNLAQVPGNVLPKEADKSAHILHEIGLRLGVAF